MLHRSTSSRRRRASRSSASSPQSRVPRSGSTPPAGRRASIAVSSSCEAPAITTSSPDRSPRNSLVPDSNRSPRLSLVPSEIALMSPRNSLAPEFDRSPRNSLVPETSRSPRHSLIPTDTYVSRSPRNSLIPDSALSPRNSIAPEILNRSSRNSLIPDSNRSPRHSLVPGDLYSSRNSLAPDFNRSPRNSLVPDPPINRSPRHSIIPTESECGTLSKSPRHSITATDMNRSPRGSIGPGESTSTRTSPRGSLGGDAGSGENRSPRGSIAPESTGTLTRSPRGSIGATRNGLSECGERSPRGSLTLTFQEPLESRSRRASADNAPSIRRSTSPYRMSVRGPQVNLGYSSTAGYSDGGSRRASSSVSQVSGDDQRRLCSESTKLGSGPSSDIETGISLGLAISLTTYGSVTYQLKDANMESSGTCDFVCRALRIVNKTVVVTVVLVCLSTLPLLMLIMGIQFLRDCPREPHIPVYMVVGGSVGCVKMAWLLWDQLASRHQHDNTAGHAGGGAASLASSAGSKVASIALNVFLIVWFVLGNYWILHIKWPEYTPTLFDPNRWCHRTLYIFSLVHLYIIYSVFGVLIVLIIVLAACQIFECSWLGPGRYK